MIKKQAKKEKQKGAGREILINVGPVEKRVAILNNGVLADFFMEREGAEHYAGNIYKGRVGSILPGIEASFIDIGMAKNGFLHVSDVIDKGAILKEILADGDEPVLKTGRKGPRLKIENVLKKNEEIMVQVVKEGIGGKGPRLTTYISLAGKYLVLTPHDKNIGISRRISDRVERKRIRDILGRVGLLGEVGCIVRTVAEGHTEKEFCEELKYLVSLWKRIKKRAEGHAAPIVLYEEYGVVLRMIRDVFTDDVAGLLVDSKEEFSRIIKFIKAIMPELKKKVKLYTGRVPLFQKYNLENEINKAFDRKVALKSGGYLIIDQTEGVVVIDVNTGSFIGKKSLEETAFKTNLEAAEAIPRQLMLRDVGGIIIIDFIDMGEKTHRDKIYHLLQDKLRDDKARISLRAMSQFGIVEMTRQRMRKSLAGSSHVECPYCSGKGTIKSIETIAIETARRIDSMLLSGVKKHKHMDVRVHPDIHEALVSNQAKILSDIQRKYRCKIEIKEDKELHIEDVSIDYC